MFSYLSETKIKAYEIWIKNAFNKQKDSRQNFGETYVRQNLSGKVPLGTGWGTNSKKAAYNKVYNKTSFDR